MQNQNKTKKPLVKFTDVAVAEDYQLAEQYTSLLNDNSIRTVISERKDKKYPYAIQVRSSDHKRAWELLWSQVRSDQPLWKSA